MSKKLITKFLIVFVISMFSFLLMIEPNVNATSFESETKQIDEILKEEKILKYDARTKEVTEVDMDELTQVLNSKNGVSNLTNSYIPNIRPRVRNAIHNTSLLARSTYSTLPMSTYSTVTRVVDTSQYPNIVTCRVHAISAAHNGVPAQNRYGTGTLVGPNIMLTAAHCVFDQNNNGIELDNGIVFPGYNDYAGAIYYGASSGWYQIYYSQHWHNGNSFDKNYDWAICVLNENLGNMVGWNGMQSYSNNSDLSNMSVWCLGYPGEPGYGFTADAGDQYKTYGSITNVYNLYFKFNARVYAGFSGGPVMRTTDDYIIGVEQGVDGNGKAIAVRITQEMINIVRALQN